MQFFFNPNLQKLSRQYLVVFLLELVVTMGLISGFIYTVYILILSFPGLQIVCESTEPDSIPPRRAFLGCHRGNSIDGSISSQASQEKGTPYPR